MLALRSLIFSLLIAILTLFYGSICILLFPLLSESKRYDMIVIWCKITLIALKIICGVHYHIIGLNNLPKEPVVFLSKHQSTWETIAFPALLPNQLCFVLKKSLLYIPFFGWTLGLTKMIYINRKKHHEALISIIRQGKEKLKNGRSIILFPEGTRTQIGTSGRYKASGAHLAKSSGAQIVPIAHNAGTCWPRHSFIKKPGIVTISIGRPISPNKASTTELNNEIKDWIENEMRKIDPFSYLNEKEY